MNVTLIHNKSFGNFMAVYVWDTCMLDVHESYLLFKKY